MKKIDQINKIINKQKNGTFISVSWVSDQSKKIRAAERTNNTVLKECSGVYMKGSSYTSRKKVIDYKEKKGDIYIDPETGKEKIACYEPFYESIPGYDYKIFGQNKKDSSKKYLLLNPCTNCKPKIKYYLNGEEISKEDLKNKGIMQPSYWTAKEQEVLHITINIDNITKVNGKMVHGE